MNRIPILTYEKFIGSYNIKSKQKKLVKKWFPILSSKELAQIVGALLTDGHIDWRDSMEITRPSKFILYSNKEKECEWFINLIQKVFSVKGRIVKYKSNTGFSNKDSFKALVYCAPLARILIAIGVPYGDKTRKKYSIPSWIMNGSIELKKAFLNVLFNFDGSISLRSRRNAVEINFVMNKQENYIRDGERLLAQIKQLLKQCEVTAGRIHIRHCKNDKFTLMLFITNFRSIINFYRNIGCLSEEKNNKLKMAMVRIYRKIRLEPSSVPNLLLELKKQFITDRLAVAAINNNSDITYSYRQFEHMRRGESLIPLELICTAVKITKKEEILEKLPEYIQDLVLFNSYLH